ncbi:TPA: phenylalanine--tRNA ligase subunit alpha [Candidatus Peribacteria bacterium]|nr:MAG: phenylalanine--tRNA ligase subunit alpha [Candidatus Peribacteria bacterium RIFOXYC2_FULL_58_10]OGJ84030.1 MAG: phenylalanine--tRNA ligase subunit alpha [Candidatus Peribacteria bacterium RIFOXYD2_FULL_58_15]HAI98758.1 phenylalanine--tRNA ligase subunit alpha [Candidatus Peribacteria bacterium]HAS34122.1 phenylalanine--tRNA ligase subunit alpha [Candidatus Peribacteria bacterium]
MTAAASLWADKEKLILEASSLPELTHLEHELFGRKGGLMTVALAELKKLPPAKMKAAAQELNEWKTKLADLIDQRRKALAVPSNAQLKDADRIDPTLELPKREQGHLHLIPEFIRQVEEVFGRMGFDVARGPEVETEEYNFNLLNIPPTHPARDAQDTFWVKTAGEEKKVLRTHTSPVQIRYMRTHKPPFRAIFPGKVYRKDADATHSPMFHQFEGLMVGKDISLANMKAVMITAIRSLISPKAEFRFRTGFFPFVEPGLEVDMRWQGNDEQSREGKWLEIVGCGMVHPQVLRNGGVDPAKWQGFAFGFGIERMIMIKHQIPDLRSFFEGDLRFLRQF